MPLASEERTAEPSTSRVVIVDDHPILEVGVKDGLEAHGIDLRART